MKGYYNVIIMGVIPMLERFNMNLISENDFLLLAVSGGIDSMVMLDFLAKKSKEINIKLAVAYLDHQKRAESFLDYQLITNVCKTHSIPTYTNKLETNNDVNFHDYAHQKRYDFFVETANEIGANKIVLAHNANDNAETIMMRLVRGSSFEGYRGIMPISTYKGLLVIRPMLEIARTEIETYQKENNVSYQEDASNQEDDYTRNRFRHHVLPLLEKENPKFLDKFNQFSNYQTMAFSLIEKLSKMFLDVFLKTTQIGLAFDIEAFKDLEQIIQIEVIKRVVNKVTNDTLELSYVNILDIRDLVYNEKPQVELLFEPSLVIQKSYNQIGFATRKPIVEDYQFEITGEQNLKLPDGSLVIITKKPNKLYGDMYKLCYNNVDFTFPLTLRNRKDGDRLKTSAGTKKLKNVFIDKKVPLYQRNTLPILVNNTQEVLWIPGIHQTKTTGNNCIYFIYLEG